jgi:hypothetical protein
MRRSNPSTAFSRELKSINRAAGMRLANRAIAAYPQRFDYANAHHEAFPLAFILAHEGRPISEEEIEKLSAELDVSMDGKDPYVDMYNSAWEHGRSIFKA